MNRFFFSVLVFGASAMVIFAPHAHALTVSPARLEVEGAPGAAVDTQFTVINEGAQPQTFYLSTENFTSQGETGAPSFLPENTGLASWITVEPQVTLAPQEARTVPFTIHVPANADPGGAFAAVFMSNVPPAIAGSGSQVSVGSKIGVLVLLRVLGDVKEGGGVIEFSPKDHQRVFTSLPVSFYYRFQNSGGDRVLPKGSIAVKDMIGLSAATLPANASEGNVLPASTRRFETVWGPAEAPNATSSGGFFGAAIYELRNFAFGRYAAHLALAYGANGQHAEATTAVYVLPWQLLLIILVIVLVVIFGGRALLRRYNRWVISHAGGGR